MYLGARICYVIVYLLALSGIIKKWSIRDCGATWTPCRIHPRGIIPLAQKHRVQSQIRQARGHRWLVYCKSTFRRRPILYRVMARIAAQTSDFAILLQIATSYHDDVQACQRQSSKESLRAAPSSALSKRRLESPSTHSTTDDPAYMMTEAILFQIVAWERMKQPKKATALRRKYNWQLQQWNCDEISAQLWPPMPNAANAHGSGSGGGHRIMDLGGRAPLQPPDWPPLVRQWFDQAQTSSTWKETRSYWSPIDRARVQG
jgi:hypothetical protein